MKKLLIILTSIVVLVVGAGLFISSQLDEARLRTLITEMVNEQLNVELRINGPLALSIFPTIGASLEGIHLSTPDNPDRDLATADTMRIGLRAGPLLQGNIEVEEIVLQNFSLELERDVGGHANWEGIAISSEALETLPDAEPAAPNEPNEPSEPEPVNQTTANSTPSVAIEQVLIKNGRVSFKDLHAKTHYELSDMSLETANINTNGIPFNLAFTSVLKVNQQPAHALAFTGEKLSVSAQQIDAGNWSIQGPGVNATGRARAQGNTASATFSMQANLIELLTALDQPLPDGVNQDLLADVDWNIALSSVGDNITFDASTLRLASTEINMSGNADFSDIPILNLNISSPLIDIDTLLPNADDDDNQPDSSAESDAAAPAKPASTSAAKSTSAAQQRPQASQSPFKATVTASIDRLRASGYEVSDAGMHLIATPQRLNLRSLNAAMYGGTLEANAIIDQQPGKAGFSANATLDGVDVGQLLVAGGQTIEAAGTVNANLDLDAVGDDPNQWINSLKGPVNFSMRQLELKDIGAEKLLCTALAALNQEPLTQTFPENTSFKDVDAQLMFNNGTATINTLDAEIPNLRVRGDGTVSLANSRLDTVFTANITGDLEELDPACRVTRKMQSIDWPITCKGGFHEDPSEWCRITKDDLTLITTKLMSDKVINKVEGKLKKLFGF